MDWRHGASEGLGAGGGLSSEQCTSAISRAAHRSPQEGWIRDGRQVLQFRPLRYDRWSQSLPSPKANHVLVEALEFEPCTLPLWRVAYKQPEDLNVGPVVPDGAVWKA